MKRIYKVITKRTDGCEGRYTYTDVEYVRTDRIDEYVEAKKVEIENTNYWWMDHEKDHGRPAVEAEAIEIKDV